MMLWIFALLPLALGFTPGPSSEYFDVLDLGKKEWRLLFRGTAHIETSVYDAYMDGAGIPDSVDQGCKGVDFSAPCTSHYRNEAAMGEWKYVKEVLFGIVDDGHLVKTLRFNGLNTNKTGWFSQKNLLESCFTDLKTEQTNYFSIMGHERTTTNPPVYRRFFINRNYGGCGSDAGWLVALDGPRTCDWERKGEKYPVFLYDSDNTVTNWNDPNKTRSAQSIVIFVKYIVDYGTDEEYFDVLKTGKKEYRLAFRGTSEVGNSLYKAYLDGEGVKPTVEDACKNMDFNQPCTSHWRNNIALSDWHDIEEVLVGVVDGGVIVQHLLFDGKGTTYLDFFSQKYLKFACWRDLMYMKKNYFSIQGHEEIPRVQRRFFINSNYGGCPNDAGWLAVIDNASSPPCAWEQAAKDPQIMYVAGPRLDNWTNGQVKRGQALVIFLKYRDHC